MTYVSLEDDGTPLESDFTLLDPRQGIYGVDIHPSIWHRIFALEPDTVIFEAKSGPYNPSGDNGFAPWAPLEDSPAAAKYLMELEDRFRSFWKLPPRSWGGVAG